ncbi:hypothetical protein niasHT_037391 [Heterodera trifolii]|uniref:Uncharacterized protein n=1 Tax=Heterodera trifolii TaxID=157864 RepID=A0ABD2J5N2_9BILA
MDGSAAEHGKWKTAQTWSKICAFCGKAWCVFRVGYSRIPCCTTDYEIVCSPKKANLLIEMSNWSLKQTVSRRLNETYETDMPNAITDFELNSTASPDSASTFCLSSTLAIYGGSIYIAAISFLLSNMLHTVIKKPSRLTHCLNGIQ